MKKTPLTIKVCQSLSVLCLGLVVVGTMAGCSAICNSPKQEFSTLPQTKAIYADVMLAKGNYPNKILRNDWQPWYYESLDMAYLYTVPYFPFFFYNGTMTLLKEGLLMPAWPIVGGTDRQDQIDDMARQHAIGYVCMFKSCWPRENLHANYTNMDQWEFKECLKKNQ